ncbi:hypothetical protein CPB83DRAFT_902092 [Crepidotus variabilis]|uniref:Virilizer N-terminal domain-containing protein n=1 Tax=Crepidotus variabilis TaxID=179855 RepID=A0A9P6JV42_9AGAR|nr:hypothetical protein CPB83DRAFT_902092 [Crepidotus variabilis]
MVLLQWCQLRPQGPIGNIAAVFFTKPVQVSSIRIFPTGGQPFIKAPEIVATTEPEAFFLDVFFNALSLQPITGNQAKNILVPSRITYTGGELDFGVELGTEYATRLIIFKGLFKEAAMAIYGTIVANPPEVTEYEPRPLPVSSMQTLPAVLDVARSVNPTSLANQLLGLIPSPAPLTLVMRLMFCLRPEKEDWDNPQFPYVYAHLDQILEDDDIESEVLDLQTLVQSVSKPLKDNISSDLLTEFAGRMRDLFGSDPTDNAFYVAQLLKKSACQQSTFAKALLQQIDLLDIFNEQTLDKDTSTCLAEAVCNAEIARYLFQDTPFIQILEDLSKNPKKNKTIQPILKKILSRIHGWQTFEDALSNPDGDFLAGAAFLKEISGEEFALGCWLESILSHEVLSSKLAAHPIPVEPRPQLPLLFERTPEITQEGFILFVRAFLGVTTVLGILVWADSLGGDDPCCERTLSVMILWQGAHGYREIMNHCLLLRQMTKRLEWLKNDEDDQRPKKPGILVERLLLGLATEPQAMLSAELVGSVLALKPPFCYISSDEVLEMEKLASVAQDGILSAFEEISFDSVRPFSVRRLRVLRVSIAIVVGEISSGDENVKWRILEMFWKERSQGLIQRLIAILVDITEDLNKHFQLGLQLKIHQALTELLMRTGDELIRLISCFIHSYPLPSRDLKTLTTSMVDIYVCSDAARNTLSPSSPTYSAAYPLKQTCLDTFGDLLKPNVSSDNETQAVRVVFRTILEHASHSSGRDPVHHITQILNVLDHVLPHPQDDQTSWSTILPHALHEVQTFCALLDPPNQLHFIKLVVAVDRGETGLGDWLIQEYLNELTRLVEAVTNLRHDPDYLYVLQYQLSTAIQLGELLLTSQDTSPWMLMALSSNADISSALSLWLSLVLDANITSAPLMRLARELGKHHETFQPDLRFNILLVILRNAQQDPSVEAALDFVPALLKSLEPSDVNVESLRNEIGRVFAAFADHAPTMQSNISEVLFQIIEWLSSQDNIKLTTLTGVSPDGFDYLCTNLSSLLPPEQQIGLSDVRSKLTVDDDQIILPDSIELPESLALPLQSIENLLSTKKKEPSTPKAGTKTPDILGVIISPPTAILRSPAATGLTKTYANNDFRQLRSSTATRLNTSRLPSTHVDEFENAAMAVDLLPAIDPTVTMAFQGLAGSLPFDG